MSDPNVYADPRVRAGVVGDGGLVQPRPEDPQPTPAPEQEPVTIATQPPMPGAEWDDPAINYAQRTAEAQALADAEMIPHPVSTSTPLVPMSDEDALALAREIEARYLPPPPPPSVISQINAMKGEGVEGEAARQRDGQKVAQDDNLAKRTGPEFRTQGLAPPPQPIPPTAGFPQAGNAQQYPQR